MARVLYSAAMSLDGYVAGPGGDMSWLAQHVGPDPDAEELATSTGALLVGARTYRGDDPNAGTDAEGAFGGTWSGPTIVVTHHPDPEPPPDVTFVGSVEEGLDLARAAAGERAVNILGADLARQCLALGAVDEIVVFVVPELLGDGVRLFHEPGGMSVRLERTRLSGPPHATSIWYQVVRSGR
ncbi:dihydrofolate reductase family protein [Pseudonocardia sp. RS11V-5]|uniref:dihydrofolate reductase family protein n=1 Tax=Pseudonocardia terrae TaxID=2905831 RepID=UPI001E5DFD16|nr:dihydrofolate reductase family protein [Pseudonocardia terrae]MCE3549924.1 dihydrofolate reductase family protein [Pseudonocardia terrae]